MPSPRGRLAEGLSSRWSRWLERLLLIFPVVVGAGLVAVLAEAPIPEVRRAVILGIAVAAVVIRVGIPVCLFFDAGNVTDSAADWEPSRYLYAGGALLVSAPFFALVYLYRRYEHVSPTAGSRYWWLVVVLAAVVGPLTIIIGLLGTTAAVGTVLAVAATIAAGLLPVGIYRDAAYVRTSPSRWNPNPALHLGLAFVCLAVAVLQPLLAGWYLGKRYRARPVRDGSQAP
jgi:hypothetical protein